MRNFCLMDCEECQQTVCVTCLLLYMQQHEDLRGDRWGLDLTCPAQCGKCLTVILTSKNQQQFVAGTSFVMPQNVCVDPHSGYAWNKTEADQIKCRLQIRNARRRMFKLLVPLHSVGINEHNAGENSFVTVDAWKMINEEGIKIDDEDRELRKERQSLG